MPVHVEWDYSKSALIPRHCSRCKHNWSFEKSYRSKGSDVRVVNVPTEQEIKNGLQAEINTDLQNPRTNVFCPKCGELARETIQNIFPKGFKDGLIDLYLGTTSDFLLFVVIFFVFLSLAVLFGFLGYAKVPEPETWIYVVKVAFLLIHGFSSLVVFIILYYWILKMLMTKKVVAAINALTEEKAYEKIKQNMDTDLQYGFGMVYYLCPEELKTKKFFLDSFLNEKFGLKKKKVEKK